MRKITLFIACLIFCISAFSQGKVVEIDANELGKEEIDTVKQNIGDEDEDEEETTTEEDNNAEEVSFGIIENVPIYQGCDESLSNVALKKCMSKSINRHVAENFNRNISDKLDLPPGKVKINTFFTIGKDGNIENIKTRGPHPKLEEEAKRVVELIPTLKPGHQRGKPVKVTFFLPITYSIQKNKQTNLKPVNKVDVDKFPIHKRCNETLGFDSQRKCTTKKIADFIQLGVDLELADKLFPQDKTTQFQLNFIIDKKGKIKDITAKAHHREMAAEAIRVAKRLPKLKAPGYKNGKPVNVPFSILMTIYF